MYETLYKILYGGPARHAGLAGRPDFCFEGPRAQYGSALDRPASQIAFQIGPASFLHRFDVADIAPTSIQFGMPSGLFLSFKLLGKHIDSQHVLVITVNSQTL